MKKRGKSSRAGVGGDLPKASTSASSARMNGRCAVLWRIRSSPLRSRLCWQRWRFISSRSCPRVSFPAVTAVWFWEALKRFRAFLSTIWFVTRIRLSKFWKRIRTFNRTRPLSAPAEEIPRVTAARSSLDSNHWNNDSVRTKWWKSCDQNFRANRGCAWFCRIRPHLTSAADLVAALTRWRYKPRRPTSFTTARRFWKRRCARCKRFRTSTVICKSTRRKSTSKSIASRQPRAA